MSLTVEQQAALDELVAYLPGPKASAAEPVSSLVARMGEPASPTPNGRSPDWMQTWLGVSGGEARGMLQNLLRTKDGLEQQFLAWAAGNPLDAAFEFIGVSAYAFYKAEQDANPKIKTYMDAFYYIATCASVGYADIFAVTQTGKAIASMVMVVGPALAAKSLDLPEGK